MFSSSWQQETWSHGNSFRLDASTVNPNISPLYHLHQADTAPRSPLFKLSPPEVTWETGSVHVLSDSESGAAGIILTPISFKTFSHVFYNKAAQRSQQVKYLMRILYKLKEKRRFKATRKAQRLLCILYLNQHCGALLLNKIHIYLFGQDFRVSGLLGCVWTSFCLAHCNPDNTSYLLSW